LAAVAGNWVYVIGVLFVVLSMGMASIHMALGTSYQVRERLPRNFGEGTRASSIVRALGSDQGRRAAGFGPVVAIFVIVEVLFLTGHESFSGPIGFVGVIAVPIVSGIFPMLMLASSRLKGDCLVAEGRHFMNRPVVVGAIVLLYLTSILVHGLFLWADPFRRSLALLIAVGIIAVIASARRTAFVPRVVVEVRTDDRPHVEPVVNVVARGNPVSAEVEWLRNEYAVFRSSGGDRVQIQLPSLPVRELKVWAHRLTAEGSSTGVAAVADIQNGQQQQHVELDVAGGQIVVPASGEPIDVTISLVEGTGVTRLSI
jgi:hypothetical protein